MYIFNLTNQIANKISNLLVRTITSTFAAVIFLCLYIALCGALISYFMYRKNKKIFTDYVDALKHAPLITKIIIKFWIELHSSFTYDLNLSGFIKIKQKTTENGEKENPIYEQVINFNEHEDKFNRSILFTLTTTKKYFRFK